MAEKKKYELPDPLNIDDLLKKKPRNRIEAIGVELEGAWQKTPEGSKIVRDGSVFKALGDDGGVGRTNLPGYAVGEVQIGPIQPIAMSAGVRRAYPQKMDKSCGLHVHMSVKKLLFYSALTAAEYQATVVHYLKQWAKLNDLPADNELWERLEGNSLYCQLKHWPWKQIAWERNKDFDQQREGHRYTAIHYCWHRTRTIECRLLPMFEDVELSISAIQYVIDITNACLVKLSDKIKPTKGGRLELPDGVTYEETIEEVL